MSSNPIKEFFKRKKMEHTFKKAGSGHQLTENASNSRTPTNQTNDSSSSQSERLADAALKRFTKPNAQKHDTLENIMQNERKRLVEEYKAQQNANTLTDTEEIPKHDDNRYVEFDNKQLFNCPTIGLNNSLPIDELILEIQNYIDNNYSEDLTLKSVMSIKNCNFNAIIDNTPKITQCVSTLNTIITNLAVDRNKFSKIRKSKIESKVLDLYGAEEFLSSIGFELDPTGEWFVYNGGDEDLTEKMNYYIDVLNSAQNFPITLDRQVIVNPQQQSDEETLSDDFYKLTADDVLRQQQELTDKRNAEESLRTQAMRDKQNKKVKCNFCRLRFKLPSGSTIDATFSTKETLQDVKTWLLVNYDTSSPITIKCGSDVFTDQHDSKTLYDLNLIPAAALFIFNKTN